MKQPNTGKSTSINPSASYSAAPSEIDSLGPDDSISQINVPSDFRGRTPMRAARLRQDVDNTTPLRMSLRVIDRTPGYKDEETEQYPGVFDEQANVHSSTAGSKTAVNTIVLHTPYGSKVKDVEQLPVSKGRKTSQVSTCHSVYFALIGRLDGRQRREKRHIGRFKDEISVYFSYSLPERASVWNRGGRKTQNLDRCFCRHPSEVCRLKRRTLGCVVRKTTSGYALDLFPCLPRC